MSACGAIPGLRRLAPVAGNAKGSPDGPPAFRAGGRLGTPCGIARPRRLALFVAVCLLGLTPAAADEPPRGLATAPWKLEAIELKDGRRLTGLIAAPPAGAAADEDVFFVQVVRQPGRPMYLITWGPLAGARVAAFDRLPRDEHEKLAGRIAAFRADRDRRLDLEATIALTRVGDGAPWTYIADEFVLESTADPGVTREAALRLTQVFGALENLVPPTVKQGPPTTVRLCGTTAEYRAEQEALGIRVANPAFFVPARRLLVAGSDMSAMVSQRRTAAAANAMAARRLEDLDRRLGERLKALATDLERQGMPPPQRADVVQKARARWLQERAADEARIEAADRENEARVAAARRRFYAWLAHEAWHAYAETRLRMPDAAGLPAWLDEGLAQVVESAPLEAGELRLDAPDPARLEALQKLLRDGAAPPLAEILRAGPDQFIAGHAGATEASGRAYLVAWGMAFDLAVAEPVLTPRAVAALGREGGGDDVAGFEQLVGMPLDRFEPAWRRRIATVRRRLP
jgi:hypothetical protein